MRRQALRSYVSINANSQKYKNIFFSMFYHF